MAALDRHRVRYTQVDTRRLRVPLHDRRRWDVVLNREISQTRAGYAANALETAGTMVLNSAAATDVCGDKWRTSVALREHGLPTPRTSVALTPSAALDALEELGYPAVLKPLVGSWGRLVTLLPDRRTAETVLEYVAALPGSHSQVVYTQEFVAGPSRDLRVVVVGQEVLGAAARHADGWRANAATGAVSTRCPLTPELAEVAAGAARAVGADIAGVDLLEDRDGRLLVLEVNHRVEFGAFQSAHGDRVDVAGRIVAHLLARAAG